MANVEGSEKTKFLSFNKNLKLELQRLSVLIMITTLIIFHSGCSKKEVVKEGYVEIVYGSWEATPENQKYIRRIIKEFEEEHPNIKVKLEIILNYEKLMTELAGGMAPDVFFFHCVWIAPYVVKGAIMAIDSFLEKDGSINRDDYFGGTIKTITYKGKLYGLPVQANGKAIAYNKDLFDKAGIKYPEMDWTLNDYLDIAKALTKDINGDGIIDQYGSLESNWNWSWYVDINGGSIFNSDGTRCLLDSPRAVEAVKFWRDLRNVYKVTPTGYDAQEAAGMPFFMSERVGMIGTNAWALREFKKIKTFKWDIAPMPLNNYNEARIPPTAHAMVNCIYSKTKHPREAYEFLKFYSGPKGMAILAESKNGIPPLKEVAYSSIFLSPPPEHTSVFLIGLDEAIPPPLIEKRSEITERIIQPYMEKIYIGEVEVEDAIGRTVAEANKLLE